MLSALHLLYKSILVIGFVLMMLVMSCKDKVICPAFQSTYILDDSIRLAFYSPFLGDSVPKETPWVRKSKYGIIKRDPYLVKNYKLKTAPMENVLAPPKADSVVVEEGDFVAEDFIGETDSLSGEVPEKLLADAGPIDRYKYDYRRDDKFNVEQEYYNKYFGELFIDDSPLPDPEEEVESDSTSVELKGIKGFFARLFKPKNKKEKVEAVEEEEDEDEYNDDWWEE